MFSLRDQSGRKGAFSSITIIIIKINAKVVANSVCWQWKKMFVFFKFGDVKYVTCLTCCPLNDSD